MTVTDIARIASQIWSVPITDIVSRSRRPCHLHPRQAVMTVANEHGISLNRIGRRLGMRHTTASHGVRVSRVREESMSVYREKISELRIRVGAVR